MSITLTSLLVGAHFRPPAKQVLACLPSGASLILVPEPENPYDPGALRVEVDVASEVPESQHGLLDESLQGTGFDIRELLDSEEALQIGYVAKSGGKPLLKAGLTVGNAEFLEAMFDLSGNECKATLSFGPDGSPRVMLTVGPPA